MKLANIQMKSSKGGLPNAPSQNPGKPSGGGRSNAPSKGTSKPSGGGRGR